MPLEEEGREYLRGYGAFKAYQIKGLIFSDLCKPCPSAGLAAFTPCGAFSGRALPPLEESCPQGSGARMGREAVRRSDGFVGSTFRGFLSPWEAPS